MNPRTYFFALALLVIALVVAFELSMMGFVQNASPTAEPMPGIGGPYLALLDGVLLYSILLMGVGHFDFKAQTARIASVVTLILSLFGIIGAFSMILAAFGAIMLMVGLLLAAPFGTIAYFATFASFPKMTAVGALSFVMGLKLFFVVMLALTNLGYMKNKGLVILIALSILATWLTSLLISLPPGFLSSITDAVGALITAIIAFILLIVMFVMSIIAVIRSLKFSRPGRQV